MSPSSFCTLLKKKATLTILNILLSCNGIPAVGLQKQFFFMKCLYCFQRKAALFLLNSYLIYRCFKLFKHRNVAFDIFPLINGAVSACTVDSIALQYRKFSKFSKNMNDVLEKRDVYLSAGSFLRLAVFYAIFISYVLVCVIVFPSNASHWFDTSDRDNDVPDILHISAIKPVTHALIFIMCSGSVVICVMLYCFVCVLLQQLLHTIYEDLKHLQTVQVIHPKCIHVFRVRFIEAANMVHITDKVFSFFGLVGLGCVFSRACACIHFYLNLGGTHYKATWFFVFTQISFDLSALTAICCFAASVSEEARKIPSVILLINNRIPPKNVTFHLQCLNFAKVILTSDVQMTAWKLFPFSRRILPTVIGVTLSYITVIIQMHHAASMNQEAANSNVTYSMPRFL